MKYVLFAYEGTGFPIAQRLREEGQEVLVGQIHDIGEHEQSEEKKYRLKCYNNILPKMSADTLVRELKKIKNPKDYFLIFETNTLFPYAQKLQNLGFHGNFPIEEDRLFEIDREKAKRFVKKNYPFLKLLPSRGFDKISKAIQFLKQSESQWVIKSQTDNVATFVPLTKNLREAKGQLTQQLQQFKEEYEKSGFILEKKFDDFVEITPEKMYYNGIPLCLTMNLENKFFGSGNIGIQVGCAGDLVFPISIKSKIHTICFPKIVDELARQHKGLFIWDASVLIDKKTGDMYFGEFCSNRFGYNSIYTEIAQAKSVHAFFENIAAEKNPLPLGTVGASLMLFDVNRDLDDVLIPDASIIIGNNAKKHAWPYFVYKKSPKDILRTTGYDKHLGPVTGIGTDVKQAVDNLYSHVEDFSLAGMYYRPKFDFLSRDYSSSILNRLDYCLSKKLFVL